GAGCRPVRAGVGPASCRLFGGPPARGGARAAVLTRLSEPPLSAPPKVKPPAPVPATVVVAASVADWDSAMLPAPATVTAGLLPVKLSGLPARVTVPALLLTVRALRANGGLDAPMSLVAVYVDDCVTAVPKVRAVADPGAGGVPPCQFDLADQLPPAGLFQVYWAEAGGTAANSVSNGRVSVRGVKERFIRRSPRLPPSPTGRRQIG